MDENAFLQKLIEKYGEWKKDSAQFGNNSYGEIANDLCYSNSHFSKLLSGNGSRGMYERAIKNISQKIVAEKKAKELENLKAKQNVFPNNQRSRRNSFYFISLATITGIALLLGFFLTKSYLSKDTSSNYANNSFHPLSKYFESNLHEYSKSPYLNISEVHTFCPCSGFEGTWSLAEEYKMPLPGNKPGLYYIAKNADIRMKCQKGDLSNEKGTKLLGFENIHNEIWLDKTRSSFSPKYFNSATKTYTEEFVNLNFESDEHFIKIADVYSCFFDIFTITNDSIHRIGEPCGRYAEVVDQGMLQQYDIDLNNVVNDVIGKMTSTSCNAAANNYCNPNELVEGESTFSFNCLFSINTENLGFGGGYPYIKGYRLTEQSYSSNLLCECGQ